MKQVTISIPEKKYPFFMELIKNLGFIKEVELDDDPNKVQIMRGIKESVNEVNLIKKGKLKGYLPKSYCMSYNIIATPKFRREPKRLVKKYQSLKVEYAELIDQLGENPKSGISIGHDCYKIRLAIASKGKEKSAGARVITYLYIEETTVFLISIYDKSERSNISDVELLLLLKEID